MSSPDQKQQQQQQTTAADPRELATEEDDSSCSSSGNNSLTAVSGGGGGILDSLHQLGESGSSGCVGTADSLSTYSSGGGGDVTPRLAFRAPWATPPKATLESNKVGGILSPPYSAAAANSRSGSTSNPITVTTSHYGNQIVTPESDFALHDLGESFPLSPPTRWETAR